MELDPKDPFEYAVTRMVEMNRKKRADYATPGNIFMNFEVNASMMRLEGYDRKEDCLSMVCRKVNRITNLRGREPSNESLVDSYEDLAVYATLLLAMALEDAGHGPAPMAEPVLPASRVDGEFCDDPSHLPGCAIFYEGQGSATQVIHRVVTPRLD